MKLVPYNPELKSVVENIEVKAEDRKFTRTPLHNIELAQEDEERHSIVVLDDEERCVGYFVLHEGSGVAPYSSNPKALFFRSFSIDARYRGQGYGTATMRELPQFVKNHYPEVNEICLTVNTDNDIAQRLYQRLNYTIQGETTLEGRPVLIMSLRI